MNKVILMGRLARDPEVRYTTGQDTLAIARFTLAVDRRMKREDQRRFYLMRQLRKTGRICRKVFSPGT